MELLLVVPRRRISSAIRERDRRRLLSSLYLATRAPVLMAPAMNTNMLEHEAVRRNLSTLSSRGVRFVEPGAGYLACGWIGKGVSPSLTDIVDAAESAAPARAGPCSPPRAGDGGPNLRGHRSRPVHRQSIEREDGLRSPRGRQARRASAPHFRADAPAGTFRR